MMQGSLAEKLRVLRAQRGLSLTEAAEKAGVQRQTLAFLERGERHPHMPTLAKIARGYGVPVEELLEEPVLAGKADAPATGRPVVEISAAGGGAGGGGANLVVGINQVFDALVEDLRSWGASREKVARAEEAREQAQALIREWMRA
jgi:transcriptional regulator with XRE-family HTH domain